MLATALRSTAVARRPALPSLGDSERDRRSRSQPRPRCPGSAASRSTFLPTSWSAPREPAPESSLLGRSRPRASARRPSRRSMCGRACTGRTRAAARALIGAGSRLAAWPARPFKFLSHSAAAKRAQSADWHVARGRSASPRRRSWPPARAQRPRHSRSASRRRSASERANSHCAARYTREPKSRLEMTYVLGRPTMKMKPMLCDETEDQNPGGGFAAGCEPEGCLSACGACATACQCCRGANTPAHSPIRFPE